MSDIRKLINIISETTAGATASGSVASVAQPMETLRRRSDEDYAAESADSTPEMPQVLEYGNWENSALTTSKKLKKARSKAKKIVKSIYGEDKPEVDETLHGKQKKLDVNKSGSLDSEDFALLRSKKKVSESRKLASNLAEGKLKQALWDDAEELSLDDFLKKHAKHNDDTAWLTDFWKKTNGVEDGKQDVAEAEIMGGLQQDKKLLQDIIDFAKQNGYKVTYRRPQKSWEEVRPGPGVSILYFENNNTELAFYAEVVKKSTRIYIRFGSIDGSFLDDIVFTPKEFLKAFKNAHQKLLDPANRDDRDHPLRSFLDLRLGTIDGRPVRDVIAPNPARIKASNKQGVAEDSSTDKQLAYWDGVAKEKKEKEREALKAKKTEHEKTPVGKAEKYWSKKSATKD